MERRTESRDNVRVKLEKSYLSIALYLLSRRTVSIESPCRVSFTLRNHRPTLDFYLQES